MPPVSLMGYEDLIRVIHENHDGMSRTYQQIAIYLTQNPNDVAIKSLNAIGEGCGIHASSFVRFAQSLGFKGFKELQEVFQRRLSTAAPGFEARIKALEGELGHGGGEGGRTSLLRELVLRDIASLQDLLNDISDERMEQAVTLMDQARTIHLIGQLRSAPVVELMRYVLTMLGKRTVLLDASGGLATHMGKLMEPQDLLIAVSFRFYARETVDVAADAVSRGVPILAITDSTLSPLAKGARALFTVPEHEYIFSRSLAAPMCVAQALVVSLAARLQKETDPRIPTVTAEAAQRA
ncbi:MurR/RpiR family transcriptional regulator [Leptothrix sp. BB-4]